MSIKEFLQKGMASRLQSLLVAFFMMVTVQGMAQKNNSSVVRLPKAEPI